MPKFIKVWDAIAVLNIPPSTFIAALKEDRKELPIFIDYMGIASKGCAHLTAAEMRQYLEDFYAGRAASEDILSFSLLLAQDVKAWKSKKATTSITELEADNEQLKARITELETELAACREQLEEARRANTSGNGDTEGFFEAYPICKLIYGLHHAGKSRDEIRAELTNKGYTNAQTGFLTQGDTLARSDKTIKQSVLRSKKDAKCS